MCVFVPGITAENREEVCSLACESRFQRSVRKAALLMYWKLNPERKKNITAAELLENVSQLNTETGETSAICCCDQPVWTMFCHYRCVVHNLYAARIYNSIKNEESSCSSFP